MSEATYTVEAVLGVTPKETQYGAMKDWRLQFKDVGAVSWFTKATTPTPTTGQQLTGTIEETQYGRKFKKAQGGGFGGGGPRPEDPKRSARILRQHSQNMAIEWVAFAHARGTLPDDFKLANLKPIIDWFDKDANEAADK